MRFINRENKLLAKSLNFGFIFLLFSTCLLSASCQTKEQKAAAVLKQCQDLLDKGELANISSCYVDAMKSNPESAAEISKAGKTAIFLKCVDFKKKSDFENAIICFEGFTELEPNMANNYFQLADSCYNYFQEDAKANGKPDLEVLDRAEKAIKAGLNIKPDDASAHALYGEMLMEKGDKRKSLTEYQSAIKTSPETSIFWIKLAQAQEKLTQNEEAVSSYKHALDINPSDTDALYFLGLLFETLERPNEAIESYEKILKIEPADEEILQKLKSLKRQKQPLKNKRLTKSKTAGNF